MEINYLMPHLYRSMSWIWLPIGGVASTNVWSWGGVVVSLIIKFWEGVGHFKSHMLDYCRGGTSRDMDEGFCDTASCLFAQRSLSKCILIQGLNQMWHISYIDRTWTCSCYDLTELLLLQLTVVVGVTLSKFSLITFKNNDCFGDDTEMFWDVERNSIIFALQSPDSPTWSYIYVRYGLTAGVSYTISQRSITASVVDYRLFCFDNSDENWSKVSFSFNEITSSWYIYLAFLQKKMDSRTGFQVWESKFGFQNSTKFHDNPKKSRKQIKKRQQFWSQ